MPYAKFTLLCYFYDMRNLFVTLLCIAYTFFVVGAVRGSQSMR